MGISKGVAIILRRSHKWRGGELGGPQQNRIRRPFGVFSKHVPFECRFGDMLSNGEIRAWRLGLVIVFGQDGDNETCVSADFRKILRKKVYQVDFLKI